MASIFDPQQAVSPYAGNQGAGGSTFTDFLNQISSPGGYDQSGIGEGIRSLAYGIGSFAKDPQLRAAYMQAAENHSRYKKSSADEDFKSLISVVPQFESLIQQAQGNPQAVAALQPMIDHLTQNIGIADKRRGGSGALGDTINQYFRAAATMPVQPREAVSDVGKINADLAAGRITQAQADAAITKANNIAGGGSSSPIGKIMDDLKAGRIDQKTADAMIRKETYISPPISITNQVPQLSVDYDANGKPVINFGGGAGTGTAAGGSKGKLTQGQDRALGLYNMAASELPAALANYDKLGNLYEQGAAALPVIGNFFNSPEYQKGIDAVHNIAQSYLYTTSGAQFSQQEVDRQLQLVTPKPGDSPARIQAKKERLATMVDSIELNLGIKPTRAASPAGGTKGSPSPPTKTPGGRSLKDILEQYAPQ